MQDEDLFDIDSFTEVIDRDINSNSDFSEDFLEFYLTEEKSNIDNTQSLIPVVTEPHFIENISNELVQAPQSRTEFNTEIILKAGIKFKIGLSEKYKEKRDLSIKFKISKNNDEQANRKEMYVKKNGTNVHPTTAMCCSTNNFFITALSSDVMDITIKRQKDMFVMEEEGVISHVTRNTYHYLWLELTNREGEVLNRSTAIKLDFKKPRTNKRFREDGEEISEQEKQAKKKNKTKNGVHVTLDGTSIFDDSSDSEDQFSDTDDLEEQAMKALQDLDLYE